MPAPRLKHAGISFAGMTQEGTDLRVAPTTLAAYPTASPLFLWRRALNMTFLLWNRSSR